MHRPSTAAVVALACWFWVAVVLVAQPDANTCPKIFEEDLRLALGDRSLEVAFLAGKTTHQEEKVLHRRLEYVIHVILIPTPSYVDLLDLLCIFCLLAALLGACHRQCCSPSTTTHFQLSNSVVLARNEAKMTKVSALQ